VPFSGESDDEEEDEDDEEDVSEDGRAFVEDDDEVGEEDEDGDDEEEEDTSNARLAGVVVTANHSASDTGRGTSSRNTTTSSTSAGDVSLTSPRAVVSVGRPANVDAFKYPLPNQICGGANTTNVVLQRKGERPFSRSITGERSSDAVTGSLADSEEDDYYDDYAEPPEDEESTPVAPRRPNPAIQPKILPPSSDSRFSALACDSPRKSAGPSAGSSSSAATAEKALERSGYLTKLGGRIKSWRRRYFVLKNGSLSYWKSQHDAGRKKPQGSVTLDERCRVSRCAGDGSNAFEITVEDANGGQAKTHYLAADSARTAEDWVKTLQNVVQRNALKLLLGRDGVKPTVEGWLAKVKHGHAKKLWCVLVGKMFIYFKTPQDQNPIGQINMRDTRVEEVETISSDSDSDEAGAESIADDSLAALLAPSGPSSLAVPKRPREPTLGIFPNHVQQAPTYLIFPDLEAKEKWLYELSVVSGGDPRRSGTPFERTLQRLMESGGDPAANEWRNPVMLHGNLEAPAAPLTTFGDEETRSAAVQLLKVSSFDSNVVVLSFPRPRAVARPWRTLGLRETFAGGCGRGGRRRRGGRRGSERESGESRKCNINRACH